MTSVNCSVQLIAHHFTDPLFVARPGKPPGRLRAWTLFAFPCQQSPERCSCITGIPVGSKVRLTREALLSYESCVMVFLFPSYELEYWFQGLVEVSSKAPVHKDARSPALNIWHLLEDLLECSEMKHNACSLLLMPWTGLQNGSCPSWRRTLCRWSGSKWYSRRWPSPSS